MPAATSGKRPRFAILGSGRGSNAEALIAAFRRGFLPAELVLVIADRRGAPILERAAAQGVETALVDSQSCSRAAHEAALISLLRERRVEHLLLAGYLRLLSADFLARLGGVVLNIHPSLLPEFPGLGAVAKQWAAAVRVAGATVHVVDAGVDSGPPVLCGSLEVRGDEGPAGLAERIRTEVEHVIYPRAVWLLCRRLEQAARVDGEGG